METQIMKSFAQKHIAQKWYHVQLTPGSCSFLGTWQFLVCRVGHSQGTETGPAERQWVPMSTAFRPDNLWPLLSARTQPGWVDTWPSLSSMPLLNSHESQADGLQMCEKCLNLRRDIKTKTSQGHPSSHMPLSQIHSFQFWTKWTSLSLKHPRCPPLCSLKLPLILSLYLLLLSLQHYP